MSSNVRAQDVLDQLTSSSVLNALSKEDLSSYDADMERYDYLFERPEVDAYLGINIDDELSYRLSLERNQWEFDFDDEQEFVDNISLVIDILESKFLHRPNQGLTGVLLGYNPNKNVLYRLTHSCSIDQLDPEEQMTTIMQDYSESPSGIEFGDLKAISQKTVDDMWIGSIYVFEMGVILIIDAGRHESINRHGIENNVVPFVYENAYIDYLEERSGELDFIHLSDGLPKELVSRLV